MQDKKPRKVMKYLHIRVDPAVHHEIKKRALGRNVSVSKYVFDSIMARIRAELQYD